jgi:hypothetical protein
MLNSTSFVAVNHSALDKAAIWSAVTSHRFVVRAGRLKAATSRRTPEEPRFIYSKHLFLKTYRFHIADPNHPPITAASLLAMNYPISGACGPAPYTNGFKKQMLAGQHLFLKNYN